MKRVFVSFIALLLILLCSCDVIDVFRQESQAQSGEDIESGTGGNKKEYIALNYDFMKAVWISQYDMSAVYKDNNKQRDKDSFIELAEQILDNVKKAGFNTIIVQVRPFGDSFYPSEYYPVSSFVSGSYGNENIYDPFEIILKFAHARSLSVHAWINPLRLMKTDEIASVPDNYTIAQWYNSSDKRGNYIVESGERYYLNPAYSETVKLIADGAAEIARKYDVDGIHMDDYFYPSADSSFDSTAYLAYKKGGGTLNLDDFRRANIDKMVKYIYDEIKAVSHDILFGISPAGNINNTYKTLYADVYNWCSTEGFIDYICPQLYFGLEHETHAFTKDYEIWSDIIKTPKVKLYIGMTLGKAKSGIDNYAGSGKYEWTERKDIIKRCLEYISNRKNCDGVAIFCYQYMYDPVTGEEEAQTKTERENARPVFDALG